MSARQVQKKTLAHFLSTFFFSYGPPKSLGSYWPQTGGPAGWPQSYSSPYFAGLQQFSNGQGLVSNIGYGAVDFSVDSVFTLIVVSRSAMAAALATRAPFANTSLITLAAGVSPTWRNARDYFEVAYAEVGLTVPEEAVRVLESNTFVELTGCPAECTYHSNIFPSACANRLVYIGARDPTNINVCNPPTSFGTSSACTADLIAGGFTLVPPTNIDAFNTQFCKPEWLATKVRGGGRWCGFRSVDAASQGSQHPGRWPDARRRWTGRRRRRVPARCSHAWHQLIKPPPTPFPHPQIQTYFDSKGLALCSRDLAKSTAMAQALQEAFTANAGNPTMQALYFRRFLLYGCQGNFNPLNTGNGYTAAGPGGLLAGEATEWLFSPVEIQDVAPGGYATTQFCLGVNGGSLLPGTDFACTDYGNVTP